MNFKFFKIFSLALIVLNFFLTACVRWVPEPSTPDVPVKVKDAEKKQDKDNKDNKDKKDTPVDLPKEQPVSGNPQKTKTAQPTEDPSGSLPPAKTSADVDQISFPEIAQSPTRNSTRFDLILNWDQIIQESKLFDPSINKERLENVKALLGPSADKTLEQWREKGGSFFLSLFKGVLLEITPKAKDQFDLRYEFYVPVRPDSKNSKIFVMRMVYKNQSEVSSDQLRQGVQLVFDGDKNLEKEVNQQLGIVKIRTLNSKNDYLIQHLRTDGLGFGVVYHWSPEFFGTIAPVVQLVEFKDQSEEFIKHMNLVSFVEIGRRKFLGQLLPLIEGIKNLKTALDKSDATIQSSALAKAITELLIATIGDDSRKNSDETMGFLLQLADLAQSPAMERIVAERFKEIISNKFYVPMNRSAALLRLNKETVAAHFGFIDEKLKAISKNLNEMTSNDRTSNLAEFNKILSELKFDPKQALRGLDFMVLEIRYKN